MSSRESLETTTFKFLPEFRVARNFPFQVTGFNFAGPLYVKDVYSNDFNDMSSTSFVSHFGVPTKVVSDNNK